MRRQRRPTPPARLSALPRSLLASLVLGLIAAACNIAPSNTPNASPGASPGASPTDVPGTSTGPSGGTGEPGQTDTEWGRIWDELPPAFPSPPGAMVSEPIGRAPSTAELAVGSAPDEIAEFYEVALGAGGFVVSTQGPLEDGSVVLDAARGTAGCELQITVTPLSGVTHVTILFGAACPFG